MKQTDIGIFLGRTPFSESSAVVSYFTRNHGFQKFLFLGAKKKNAQLFPLNVQELDFYQRPDSELGKLTSAKGSLAGAEIPFHPIRSSLAFFIAEIISKCVNHSEKDEVLFSFLMNQISTLNQTGDLAFYALKFLMGFAETLGFEPQILDEHPDMFHLDEGAFQKGHQAQNSISGKPMELLLAIMRSEPLDSFSIKDRRNALDGLIRYYQLHFDHFGKLKSKEVLDAVFQA